MDGSPQNRVHPGDRYQPYNGDMEKGQPVETTSGMNAPQHNSGEYYGRTPAAASGQEDMRLTDGEMALLRKLRTFNMADYEGQYLDSKHTPNMQSMLPKMGNPTPLAVAVFGITNTLLALTLMQTRKVEKLNYLSGMFWFTAGVTNLLVAFVELFVGNTFTYVIFGSLGGYFMSLGTFVTPAFGMTQFYATSPAEIRNALGIFNMCWAMLFIIFFIISLRANVFMIIIFGCISVSCILISMGDFEAAKGNADKKHNFDKIGGIFLLVGSLPNWYLLFMMLAYSAGWKLKLYTGEIGPQKHATAAAAAAAHSHKMD